MNSKLANREFQVWDYWVSHSQLLLRSPSSGDIKSNIDVSFKGVDYIELPCDRFSLKILEPTEDDIVYAQEKMKRALHRNDKVFILSCNDEKRYVVAAWMTVEENILDLFESSLTRNWSLPDS